MQIEIYVDVVVEEYDDADSPEVKALLDRRLKKVVDIGVVVLCDGKYRNLPCKVVSDTVYMKTTTTEYCTDSHQKTAIATATVTVEY